MVSNADVVSALQRVARTSEERAGVAARAVAGR